MNPIQFHAVVGPDQVIRPPAGVVLPEGDMTVVVTATVPLPVPDRKPGACKGMILYMAPDFDEPLEDMAEYM